MQALAFDLVLAKIDVANHATVVWTIDEWSCTSALSRDFLLISSCCRMLSILKSRSSGCVTLNEKFDCRIGLKLVKKLVVDARELFQPNE